jgi:hypothetical protein
MAIESVPREIPEKHMSEREDAKKLMKLIRGDTTIIYGVLARV